MGGTDWLGVAFGLGAAAVAWLFAANRWVAWIMLAACLTIFWWRTPVPPISKFIGGGVMIGAALAYAIFVLGKFGAPEIEYYKTPLTLRNLFDTDFNQVKVSGETTFTITNRTTGNAVKVVVQRVMVLDFNARSRFLAFFVPTSTETFNVCEALASGYHHILEDLDRSVSVMVRSPADTDATEMKDTTFSGRIYIYHEDSLSLQQLASLDTIFKSQGADARFRGQDYLVFHWNEQREKPAERK
jgi:hypothetical protein